MTNFRPSEVPHAGQSLLVWSGYCQWPESLIICFWMFPATQDPNSIPLLQNSTIWHAQIKHARGNTLLLLLDACCHHTSTSYVNNWWSEIVVGGHCDKHPHHKWQIKLQRNPWTLWRTAIFGPVTSAPASWKKQYLSKMYLGQFDWAGPVHHQQNNMCNQFINKQ